MGTLDGREPGRRLIRLEASRAMLIHQMELIAERGPELVQAASEAIGALRDGVASVTVDGVEYVVVEG